MQFVWGKHRTWAILYLDCRWKCAEVKLRCADACAMCMCIRLCSLCMCNEHSIRLVCMQHAHCPILSFSSFYFAKECNIFIGWRSGGGANGQTALHVFRWQMQFVFLISVHTMWQMINAIRKMISKTTTIIRHFKKSKWHTEKLERASKFLPLWRFAICFFER